MPAGEKFQTAIIAIIALLVGGLSWGMLLRPTLIVDASELANWTFSADQARLLPGETARFVTRFQNPPAGASALSIDFSSKGK